MAKNKQQKKEIIDFLSEKADLSKSIVFARFDKLGVKENEDLRRKLGMEKSEYYVAKKTLLNLVMKEKFEGFSSDNFDGQVAAVFGYEDEVAPAKILNEYIKANEGKMEFVGGVLEKKMLSAAEVKDLALLPSKPELYARIVGSLNAPISGIVNVMAGNLRSLVYVLKAIEEKKA